VDPQALLQNYFLERILVRISQSSYKENIILKGGLLIASLIGSSNRSTMDLDATIKNYPMTKEDIEVLVKEIIVIDVGDKIEFELIYIKSIREEDEYNGFRVKIDAKFERILQHLKLDFSTGDRITPGDINYSYKSMFEEKTINIQAYNIETIIAEKYETILSRGEANTRMRDFYDLYILKVLRSGDIDFEILAPAIRNTAEMRNTTELLLFEDEIIQRVKESNELKKLWIVYSENFSYAKQIGFKDTIDAIQWIHNNTKL